MNDYKLILIKLKKVVILIDRQLKSCKKFSYRRERERKGWKVKEKPESSKIRVRKRAKVIGLRIPEHENES